MYIIYNYILIFIWFINQFESIRQFEQIRINSNPVRLRISVGVGVAARLSLHLLLYIAA